VTLGYSRVEPNVSLSALVSTPGLNLSNFNCQSERQKGNMMS